MTTNVALLRDALTEAARRVHILGHQWRAVMPFEECTYEECRRVRALLEVTKP